MGISSLVLFEKNKSISAKDLFNFIKTFCLQQKLIFDYAEERYEGQILKYICLYISDKPFVHYDERQISFSIYDEPYRNRTYNFKWDIEIEYFQAIISNDFDGNEDLLFKIMFAIVLKYPEAKLWIEEDWFYTLEDLKK